jgi:hypothetical protein
VSTGSKGSAGKDGNGGCLLLVKTIADEEAEEVMLRENQTV